jgi:hypothetical protein
MGAKTRIIKKCSDAIKPCNYINIYAWQGPRAWRACRCQVPGARACLDDTCLIVAHVELAATLIEPDELNAANNGFCTPTEGWVRPVVVFSCTCVARTRRRAVFVRSHRQSFFACVCFEIYGALSVSVGSVKAEGLRRRRCSPRFRVHRHRMCTFCITGRRCKPHLLSLSYARAVCTNTAFIAAAAAAL